MKRFISVLLVIALLVPMLCVDVFAADHQVKDFDELKAAIASAANGDVITVASNITLDETLAIENKSITIKGSGKISADNALTTVATRKNTLFVINNSTVKFNGLDENQKLTLDGDLKNRIIYSEGSTIELTNAVVTKGCPGDNSNINPGGGIFLRGGSLTATDTVFSNNKPGSATGLPQGDGDLNGGAIYSGSTKADITITGGSFVDNEVKAYGHGAAIYQENGILNVTDTKFKGNSGYLNGEDPGTQGACIHTRDKVTAKISNVEAEIAKGFNTGGFLRSWKSNVTVINSTFTIAGLGDGYGYSGGALCFEGGTSKVTGSTFTCTGSKLYHAGGFIDIVGTGTHVIDGNKMTGAGKENGQQIASFGGAISVEEGASATVTITNNTIKDTSASDNGGAIAIGTHKGKSTPSTVTMSGNTISNAGTLFWGAQYGGGVFVAPDATVTMTKDTIKDTRSSYGGGVYNEGNLTITGGSSLTGGVGSKLGGEIYNNGELTVDDATITGNFVGGAAWQQYASHGKNFELGGTNIYAEKDVTITPNATIATGKDVRVLDGQSKILLTGALTKEIDVSVSEIPGGSETQKRRVGYVVAEGTGYTVTKSDANFLHYIGRNNKTDANHYSNQARAAFSDHEGVGAWDFLLNPQSKQVVLGQRVKLTLHANGLQKTPAKFEDVKTGRNEDEGILTKLPSEDKKEDIYDIYTEGEKSSILSPEPIRKGYAFTGWYKEAIVNDDAADENKSGKTKVTDQKLVEGTGEITTIINPNEYELYAGWEKVILVEKVWDDNNDEYDNRPDKITVKLLSGSMLLATPIELNAQNNWKGEFRNIRVPKRFRGYQVKEDPEQILGYTAGVVTGDDINGFVVTNSTEFITIEGSKTWEHGENPENKRPTSVTVKLSDGTKEESKTVGANDNWSWKFKKLPKYKKQQEVKYTLTENTVDHYTSTMSDDGFSFTNTFTNKYKVTYEFKAEDSSKTLPEGVTNKKPEDKGDLDDGTKITPETFNDVTTEDGTWKFKEWQDKNSNVVTEQTINKADIKFIGIWKFIPKTYNVTYEFKAEGTNKTLPEAVTKLKPENQTGVANGTKITPATFNSVTDGEDTWTFKGWNQSSQTINKADIHFIGTWALAAKPEQKTGSVYVKYIDEEGKEIADKTELKKDAPVGEDYTATPKTIEGYEDGKHQEGSAPVTGKVKEGEQTVVYVYKKIEKKSDFTITKTVDKTYYEKAGEVLTYTVIVTNTGEKKLENLILTDALMDKGQLINPTVIKPFELAKGESKTFTYTYTITDADVRAREVINTASVKIGEDGKPKDATAKSILKVKEKRGDVYVRYETEDGKILDEFAVLIDAPVGTYYYTEEKVFPRYRFVGLATYSDPAEGYVVEGTQYVVYLYRRDRGGRTPDRRDRYDREEKEVEEPIVEAKRKPELNKKDHKQYMYGYPDWTFVPAANITRGEAAAMFARLFKEYPGLDYNYKKYYTDVDESYWGFKEVAYLSEFGILSGYSDGTFRPNNKITRAEFVKIAESFEALTWGLSPYNDVDGGHWAFRYIVSSAAKGWISGYPDGSFRPNSFISRAEAVTIVNKLLERRPDKDYIDTHKPELKPFTDLKPSYWAYYEIYEAVDGHDYNRSFTDIEEHWYRLNNERFVFSQPRYYR
jgi:uncharacterized repeat protein (TIGR01451 family)/uncharacterized repeat protein (TIGR02543 family)